MTIVKGEIESLKRIKDKLKNQGIQRFNSVGDIKSFEKNYENEKQTIYDKTEHELDLELETLEGKRSILQKEYNIQKTKSIGIIL